MVGIIDIHCHVIPEVDDGAKTLEDSKKMLELAYAEGIRKIIATHHFCPEIFASDIVKIERQYQKISEIAKHIGDGIEVFLGCEYYAKMNMSQKLQSETRCTLANTKYVLIEFLDNAEFSYIRAIVQDLVSNGYKPILAHIERYDCLYKREYIKELHTLGAQMQINADSVIGKSGHLIKRFCKKIIKDNLVDFIATDGHDLNRRQPKIEKCANYLEKKMGYEYTRRILIDNPQKIIDEISKE